MGPEPPSTPDATARLGVSACLMGENVRYDGGHKQDRLLIDTLGRHVEWVYVCPEVEVGMGTPRETLRLEGEVADPRLVAPSSGQDWTAQMKAWARERLEGLAALDLHGFVLKKGSPSCGSERVPVYADNGEPPAREGRGIFAAALHARLPLLPIEEEGRLGDSRLRESFIERIFAYRRWTALLRDDPTPRGLVRFHGRLRLAYLAHSTQLGRELDRIVADAGERPWAELSEAYGEAMMRCLTVIATRGRHRKHG